jgi:anaerobic selenocysteine-containing dehydrogenase
MLPAYRIHNAGAADWLSVLTPGRVSASLPPSSRGLENEMSATVTANSSNVFTRNCPLCEGMCGVKISVADDTVTRVRPNEEDTWSRGHICPKGTVLGALHHDPDRLHHPVIREGSSFREVSWEAAFERLTELSSRVRERYGIEGFASYGGNMVGKDATLGRYAGLLFRTSGIRQIYSSSTVDQQPKNVSCQLMFGNQWKIPIPDIDRTELFLIFGANPAASKGSILSHQDVMRGIRELRRRGGRVIVIDPVRTATAQAADQWIGVRPGSDAALLLAIANVLFTENRIRLGHLADLVTGLDEVRALAARFSPERVAGFCGVTADTIRGLAHELARVDRAAIYGRIGLCTQEFGTLASWMIDVLAILTGNLDRPGGSMWSTPVSAEVDMLAGYPAGAPIIVGKSRVRGARGVLGRLPSACLAEEIDTPGAGQIKGLLTIASNPVLSAPESERLAAALPLLECMVSLDNYINETTRHAHVIFPSVSLLEASHFDTWSWIFCLTSGGHYSPPLFKPVGRPEPWEVVARVGSILGGKPEADPAAVDDAYFSGLAKARGIEPAVALAASPTHGHDRIIDLAIRTGAFGDRYGAIPDGLNLDSFRNQPNGLILGLTQPQAHKGFPTPSGKIELAHDLILEDVPRLEAALEATRPELVLVSRRHLASMNSWMHNVDVLMKGKERCTLQLHPEDAARLGVEDGDMVEIESASGAITAPAEVTSHIRPGVVCMPHGWGHSDPGARQRVARAHAGSNINVLSPGTLVDVVSGNAVLNGIAVQVRRVVPVTPALARS